MCEKGKAAKKFFNKVVHDDGTTTFSLKPLDQYVKETGSKEQPSKRYFKGTTLSEIINSYPIMRKNLSKSEVDKEMLNRMALIDFLQGVLNLNPLARWSPEQAQKHPFITGEPFNGPFVPNTIPISPSKSFTTLQNGEVREIRGVRPRIMSQKSKTGMGDDPSYQGSLSSLNTKGLIILCRSLSLSSLGRTNAASGW